MQVKQPGGQKMLIFTGYMVYTLSLKYLFYFHLR
jgi:hypothetical protein